MDERRIERRFEVCLEAVWEGATGNYDARITDLSDQGCYVDVMCESYIGEVVKLNFRIPTGEWLDITGEVAHHTPQLGFGLRFLELKPDHEQKIQILLEYLQAASTNADSGS